MSCTVVQPKHAKTARNPKGAGRPPSVRNKLPHRTGRPKRGKNKKPTSSVWHNGRIHISLTQQHIDESMQRNSSHCAGVAAIKEAIPDATFVSLDLQSWRLSRKGCRYVGLTPHVLQDFLVNYDQGNAVSPITFTLKPAYICKAGKKRTHTPDPEQLTDVGLRVSPHQPHLPTPTPTPTARVRCGASDGGKLEVAIARLLWRRRAHCAAGRSDRD
jgi:hypothetical protein